jgi:hypothetical protein
MAETNKRVLTSVKIPQVLYEDFKTASIRTRLGLQDIVERSIYLYITDPEFRMTIHQQYSTYYTGSNIIDALKSI